MVQPSPPRALQGGLLGLGLFALGLRFWHLGRLSSLVFDEVYYVPFALGYLHQTPAFDAHPPLGKYLIALGISLSRGPATWLHWPRVMVEADALSPVGFRWMNALVGATLPVLLAALAWSLSSGYDRRRRIRFSLITGGLMGLEGLSLVESRLALINLYWLWFGLLGQWCWLVAGQARANPQLWRIAAGLALGAAMNVKWNGAGFWLGLILGECLPRRPSTPPAKAASPGLLWGRRGFYLGLLPLITYSLLWLPHLALTGDTLGQVHRQIWQAHQSIGADRSPHPYCSAWYTWPLMLRPVAYYHQALGQADQLVMMAPFRASGETIQAIQGMGNPVLWWLGTAAVLALGLGQVSRWQKAKGSSQSIAAGVRQRAESLGEAWFLRTVGSQDTPRDCQPLAQVQALGRTQPVEMWILINYLANWLPWLLVSRCTFLYHALGMVAFSTLGLAWLLSRWLSAGRRSHQALALGMIVAIALGFWFWLPVWLGLPLSPEALQRRWWLPSWI
ncbi:MAG TPA: phospholipid carrier-dependent glycosyltransferase [Leptolyngbyaceae cyanobacterium M65_K2018_010]|nr:phospholipid carrier-dependent glycosyltransferase [Leptolyngbyaceae cyanobacterium M65_K2018_010]